MREYDSKTLKKVQSLELSVLKDFIKICEENGLTYFGMAGTGIGALRHGGFIPWDDDIDIVLFREDYEKALEIIKRDYSDRYTVVNGDEFSGYPLMTTRITVNNSLFIEEPLKTVKCPLGIFLDVYALDAVSKDPKKRKRQINGTWFFSKLLILKHIPFPVLPFKGVKAKILHAITWCAHCFLNVFCISHKWLYNKGKSISCKYNGCDADEYGYFFDTVKEWGLYKKEDIYPLRKEKFEDIYLNFPNNLEKSLETIYGDWKQLPPPEKRKNHFPYALKFPDEETVIYNK